MGVGEDKIIIITTLCNEVISDSPNAGTCIDNDDLIILGPNLNAWGITSIFDVFPAGYGN